MYHLITFQLRFSYVSITFQSSSFRNTTITRRAGPSRETTSTLNYNPPPPPHTPPHPPLPSNSSLSPSLLSPPFLSLPLSSPPHLSIPVFRAKYGLKH